MKKTLDEIINRSDYKNINEALKERCFKLARIIFKKMKELDVKRVEVNGDIYSRASVTSRVDTYHFLAVEKKHDAYYSQMLSLMQDYFEYYTGDFNAPINPATSKDFLRFLNNARAILDRLDEIETDKVASIQQAIDATEDLMKEGSHD